jgi:pyrroloquinoline quinone biosynthesis protein D
LQTDRATGKPVALFPEGMLQLNPTGAAILDLCDGQRSLTEITAALAEKFKAPPGVLDADVAEYLNRLRHRGLVRWDEAAPPERP